VGSSADLVGVSSSLADKNKAHPDVGRQARSVLVVVLLGLLAAFILMLAALLLWLWPGGTPVQFGRSLFGQQLQAPIVLATAGGVAMVSLLVLFFWRWRAKKKVAFQSAAGCPACHNHDLVRIRRRQLDRPIGRLTALPLQRYACRTCTWQGLLIGSERQGFSSNLSTAALLEADAAVWLRPTPSTRLRAETAVPVPPAAPALPPVSKSLESDTPPSQVAERPPAAVAAPLPPPLPTRPTLPATATTAVAPATTPVDNEPAPEPAPASLPPTLKIRTLEGKAGSITLEPLARAAAVSTPTAPQAVPARPEPASPLVSRQPSPTAGDTGSSSRAIVVAPFGLKLRAEPRADSALLRVLPPDTVVTLLGQADNGEATTWRKVSFGGMTGWASAAFLRRLPELPSLP
jgi:hypothetical protein